MDTLSLTKEARIYNGENTISLTSGPGKTGQPLVNTQGNTALKPVESQLLTEQRILRVYQTPSSSLYLETLVVTRRT